MKKVLLLAVVFSFVLALQPAFATPDIQCNSETCVLPVPSYSVLTGDWQTPGVKKSVDLEGKITFEYENEGAFYYNTNLHVFYYVLTKPNKEEQILKVFNWDERNQRTSVEIENPYYVSGKTTRTFSQVKLPAQNFQIPISETGKYKVELRQAAIPAVVVDKNSKSEYSPNDVLDKWTAESVRYFLQTGWTTSAVYCTDRWNNVKPDWYCREYPLENSYNSLTRLNYFKKVSCASQTPEGKVALKEIVQSGWRLQEPNKGIGFDEGSTDCEKVGMKYLNENYVCKFPQRADGLVEISPGFSVNAQQNLCWVESNQLEKIKVSDLGFKSVWSSEFDLNVPVLEESAAAINPFSQSRGSSENKNTGSSNGSNSNTGNIFPIAGAALAVGAAGVYLAGSRRGKIVVRNFVSGFTEYGKAQIQKTKEFFAFLQAEKEGYWVKKWKAEQEERARAARERETQIVREKFERIVADTNQTKKDFDDGKITKTEYENKIENINQTANQFFESRGAAAGNSSDVKKVYEAGMGMPLPLAAGWGAAQMFPGPPQAKLAVGIVVTIGTYALMKNPEILNSIGSSIGGALNSFTGILRNGSNLPKFGFETSTQDTLKQAGNLYSSAINTAFIPTIRIAPYRDEKEQEFGMSLKAGFFSLSDIASSPTFSVKWGRKEYDVEMPEANKDYKIAEVTVSRSENGSELKARLGSGVEPSILPGMPAPYLGVDVFIKTDIKQASSQKPIVVRDDDKIWQNEDRRKMNNYAF